MYSLLSHMIREKYPLPCALISAEVYVIVEAKIAIKAMLEVFLTPGILFDSITYNLMKENGNNCGPFMTLSEQVLYFSCSQKSNKDRKSNFKKAQSFSWKPSLKLCCIIILSL